jgi:hypothetical protein
MSTVYSKNDKKISSKTVGNQHQFPQQNASKRKKPIASGENFALAQLNEDIELDRVVDRLSRCCNHGTENGFGCILSLFRTSSDSSFSIESFKMSIWIVVSEPWNILEPVVN